MRHGRVLGAVDMQAGVCSTNAGLLKGPSYPIPSKAKWDLDSFILIFCFATHLVTKVAYSPAPIPPPPGSAACPLLLDSKRQRAIGHSWDCAAERPEEWVHRHTAGAQQLRLSENKAGLCSTSVRGTSWGVRWYWDGWKGAACTYSFAREVRLLNVWTSKTLISLLERSLEKENRAVSFCSTFCHFCIASPSYTAFAAHSFVCCVYKDWDYH